MAERPGVTSALRDYEVLNELGRGAMGIVYLGRHRNLDRMVAIKELPASFAADPEVRARFVQEARTVAALDHPHVVVVHDFIDRDGHLALVMEQLPNGTVWERFVSEGLSAPTSCALMLSTAAGLEHAHDRSVLHRDIKPENLMFAADGQLKVTDFGIAHVVSGDETVATLEGSIVGTPAYMAPEQAEGTQVGRPADVYACGTMLYEMLSGRLPFSGTTPIEMLRARLNSDPVPLASVAPGVPGPIVDVAMRALAKSTSDRYGSAEEFAIDLATAAAKVWGPDWLDASGIAVRGADSVERAARTTYGARSAPPAEPAPQPHESQPFESQPAEPQPHESQPHESPPPASLDHTPGTVVDGVAVPPSAPPRPPNVDPTSATVPLEAQSPLVEPPLTPSPAVPLDLSPVVPVVAQHQRGADLNQLSPADFVNVRELSVPPRALVPFLIGLAIAGFGVAAALLGFLGSDPDPAVEASQVFIDGRSVVFVDEAFEVDLTAPFAIRGTDASSIDASFLGIPLGSVDLDGGEVDPSYLRWTTAPTIDFTLSGGTDDGVSFPVRPTNSYLPTAPFVAAVIALLAGLASVQANLRGLRGRRLKVGPYLGLFVSGAILGAGIALMAIVALNVTPAVPTLVGAAVGVGLGSVALGEAYRRFRRRRRLMSLQQAP